VICPTPEQKYFCAKGWTGFADLPVGLFCRRRRKQILLAREATQRGGLAGGYELMSPHRHCEEHLRRSNPYFLVALWIASLRSQ
jgi:hypothetical protein